MKISVALCTYNGSPYLLDQLRSISSQERPPDEVVICDDCSTDDTVELAQRWASTTRFPVRVVVNDHNLGLIKNFEKATELCEGDVISLCDQDDVWHPSKLARSAHALAAKPSAAMVFSDADVVDDRLRSLGYRMWRTRRFRGAEKRLVTSGRGVDVLLRRNVVTGATMAFRSEYKDLLLPIPQNAVHVHDEWIAFFLAAVADISLLDAPLMQYRQRPAQAIGAHPPTGLGMLLAQAAASSWDGNVAAHRDSIDWYERLAERLKEHGANYSLNRRVLHLIEGKIEHLQRRICMPRSRIPRALFVARELSCLGYHRYSIGMWAAAKDMAS
jgi:glycosyltransferase involved in cell wall biosynthesis